MTLRLALRLSMFAVAAALTAVACGGSGAPGGAGGTSTPDAGQSQGSDAAEFGLSEQDIVTRVDQVEQAISVCMSKAGFEYVPVNYAAARQAMDANSKPGGLSADEFRAQFGYGVTTLAVNADAQGTLGLGPNIAIRDALPPADRVAWVRQLLGEHADQTFVVGLDSEDLSQTGGCTRTAVEANFSADELGPAFVNFQNAEGARVSEDARVIDAYKAWSGCMRDAGFGYDNTADIEVDLLTRFERITNGVDPASLPADLAADLKDLRGEELAIAAADHRCDLENVADVKAAVELEIFGRAAN